MADKKNKQPRVNTDPREERRETNDLLIDHNKFEAEEAKEANIEAELAKEEKFDTQHSDGHTLNPYHAQEQGLTYTPPTDPPVQRGDDPQGAEIATGYAPSMEAGEVEARKVPARVDDNDFDLLEKIDLALRNNSETGHLTDVEIKVENGVATLSGTVPSEQDIATLYAVVSDLDGVAAVDNKLRVTA